MEQCPLCGHELPCPTHVNVLPPMCRCGSRKDSTIHYDGHGIYLFRACEDCYETKIRKYRPDILSRYDTDEQIEEDY